MQRDVLPYLHVDFLDIEMLKRVVNEIQVSLNTSTMFEDMPDYLDKDLVAVLLDYVGLNSAAFDPYWF